jgi:hypothetical protein
VSRERGAEDEPPPILGSWRNLYLLIVAELLAIIVLCGWLARVGR